MVRNKSLCLLCYIISLFMSNWRINNPTLGILTFLRTILECHFKERFWRKWKFLEFLGLTVTETKISCVIKKHTYYHIHHMSSNFLMIEKNNFAWSFKEASYFLHSIFSFIELICFCSGWQGAKVVASFTVTKNNIR